MIDSLNSEQRQAVEYINGPLMIIAGPGTGKTNTLVHRIAYFIQKQSINPGDVLALTFTKKAVEEIKQRLAKQFNLYQVSVCTFHSLAKNIIEQSGETVNIIDPLSRQQLLKQLFPHDFSDANLLISRYKSGLAVTQNVSSIVDKYNQELQKLNLIDFDDLLIKALELPEFPHFSYILVDEFQDTNQIQYLLLKKILPPTNNICVIGDPYQSIYAFRGADSRIFEMFKRDFPKHKQITLKINYRNGPEILEASQRLFPQSDRLFPSIKSSSEYQLVQTPDEFSEADFIINFISQKIGGLNLSDSTESSDLTARFSDFAVIYRTHQLSRVLQQKFLNSGIPFQLVGGDHPLLDPSIISLFSHLKTLSLDSPPLLLIDQSISQLKIPSSLFLSEFRNSAIQFPTLGQFIQYYDQLIENNFYDPYVDKVSLLSMHATKGLEFKYVFICGFEASLIPHSKADPEEETRLLYVALTRARNGLYLIAAKNRGRKKHIIISPLLERIKTSNLEFLTDLSSRRQLSRLKKSQMSLF